MFIVLVPGDCVALQRKDQPDGRDLVRNLRLRDPQDRSFVVPDELRLPDGVVVAEFLKIFLIKPHSHPNEFYWGHQSSWTLIPAYSMQVSIMQSDDRNRR